MGLLKGTKGNIELGGSSDEGTRYFPPTIVTDVTLDDALMKVSVQVLLQ